MLKDVKAYIILITREDCLRSLQAKVAKSCDICWECLHKEVFPDAVYVR